MAASSGVDLHNWDYNFLSQITIFEYSESLESESVQYDAAILFEFENNTQILFSRQETIAGYIEVNYKSHVIKEVLKTMKIRKVIASATGRRKEPLIKDDKDAFRLKIRY